MGMASLVGLCGVALVIVFLVLAVVLGNVWGGVCGLISLLLAYIGLIYYLTKGGID